MWRIFIFLAALCALPAYIHAQGRDSRVLEQFYSPETVYVINGVLGIQTAVQFGEGERIENIAIGDGSNWQVTPNKRADILFIKPMAAKKVTNLTIVTNKRTYLFELSSLNQKARPLFTLRFTYPPEPEEQTVLDIAAIPPEALSEANAVETPQINHGWAKSGKQELWPSEIFDDGTLTYLKWPRTTTPPAIYAIGADGNESLVNQLVQNDYFIIDYVPSSLMLRLGKAKARLDRRYDGGAAPAPKGGS